MSANRPCSLGLTGTALQSGEALPSGVMRRNAGSNLGFGRKKAAALGERLLGVIALGKRHVRRCSRTRRSGDRKRWNAVQSLINSSGARYVSALRRYRGALVQQLSVNAPVPPHGGNAKSKARSGQRGPRSTRRKTRAPGSKS